MITRYYARKMSGVKFKVMKLPVESMQVARDAGVHILFETLTPSHFKPNRNTDLVCYGDVYSKLELQTHGFIENNWVELKQEEPV